MATEHTLLSFIMRRYISAREDAATDALGFILNRSEAARAGFSDFLREHTPGIAPIRTAQTWLAGADGGVPDLACLADGGQIVALVESKFWAELTRYQPVSYWERLPADTPSTLLVIAPEYRVSDTDYLWNELTGRLRQAGHKLEPAERGCGLVSASHIGSPRRLILASWDLVLDHIERIATERSDTQAIVEIGQLRGVVSTEYDATDMRRDDVLRNIIRDAVNRAAKEGWVDISGLSWGGWRGFPGRFLRLAGAYAFLGLNYPGLEETDRLIWLVFNEYGSQPGNVTIQQVHQRLGIVGRPGAVRGRNSDYSVLLETPSDGMDLSARVQFVVDQLAEIGRKINPEAFPND